ncbi:MAG: PilZ domain-containing protein [Bacteriovoracaceae bacterium]|nr:PilZ domain-containing protein [Bacteriovoracaceae bacterium]
MNEKFERRGQSRLAYNTAVFLKTKSIVIGPINMVNISLGGMLLQSTEELDVGTKCIAEFKITSVDDYDEVLNSPLLKIKSEIRRCTQDQLGVRFIELKAHDFNRINSLIESGHKDHHEKKEFI